LLVVLPAGVAVVLGIGRDLPISFENDSCLQIRFSIPFDLILDLIQLRFVDNIFFLI